MLLENKRKKKSQQAKLLTCSQEFNQLESSYWSSFERPSFEIGVFSNDNIMRNELYCEEEEDDDVFVDSLNNMTMIDEQLIQSLLLNNQINKFPSMDHHRHHNNNITSKRSIEPVITIMSPIIETLGASTKDTSSGSNRSKQSEEPPVKRKRGRPRKSEATSREQRKFQSILRQIEKSEEKTKSAKKSETESESESGDDEEEKDKLVYDEEEEVSEEERKQQQPQPKKRGRPRKIVAEPAKPLKRLVKQSSVDQNGKKRSRSELTSDDESDNTKLVHKKRLLKKRSAITSSEDESIEKITIPKRKIEKTNGATSSSSSTSFTTSSDNNSISDTTNKKRIEKEKAKMFKYLQNFIVEWKSDNHETDSTVIAQSNGEAAPNIPGVSSSEVSYLSAENVEVLTRVMPKLNLAPSQQPEQMSSPVNTPRSTPPLRSILKRSKGDEISPEDATGSEAIFEQQYSITDIEQEKMEEDSSVQQQATPGDNIFGVKIPKKAGTQKISLAEYAQRKSSMDLNAPVTPNSSSMSGISSSNSQAELTPESLSGSQFSGISTPKYYGRGLIPSPGVYMPPAASPHGIPSPIPSPASGRQPYPFPNSNAPRPPPHGFVPPQFQQHPYGNKFNPPSPPTYQPGFYSSGFPKPPDLPVPPNQSPKDVLLSWSKQYLKPHQIPHFEPPTVTSEGYRSGIVLPHLSNTIISTKLASPTIHGAENQAAVRAMEHLWRLYSNQNEAK
jgi:hypothetical protein